MIDTSRLPIPASLNVTELAKRWGCTVHRVLQYIDCGLLTASHLGWMQDVDGGSGDEYGYEIFLEEISRFEQEHGMVKGDKGLKLKDDEDVSSKTRNSYLKLIRVLCDFSIDGLTGRPHTDAEAVIAALKSRGKDCPVGTAALAKYLKDAAGL